MGAWGLDLHRGAQTEEKQAEKIKESGYDKKSQDV